MPQSDPNWRWPTIHTSYASPAELNVPELLWANHMRSRNHGGQVSETRKTPTHFRFVKRLIITPDESKNPCVSCRYPILDGRLGNTGFSRHQTTVGGKILLLHIWCPLPAGWPCGGARVRSMDRTAPQPVAIMAVTPVSVSGPASGSSIRLLLRSIPQLTPCAKDGNVLVPTFGSSLCVVHCSVTVVLFAPWFWWWNQRCHRRYL